MARKIYPIEHYIKKEEEAIMEYMQLAEALFDLGEITLAKKIFEISLEESRHVEKLRRIQKMLLGKERI